MSDFGITDFGAYVPRLRLERSAVAAAHAWMAPSLKGLAKGARAFCSWDEDAITMAVEAARDCAPAGSRASLTRLTLASTTLPYADLQNSAIVAGALGLAPAVRTTDVGGSVRAGVTALISALQSAPGGEALVVASERPRAKPASSQEISCGAGAAAFRLGTEGVVARLLGAANHTAQFIDHFRPQGSPYDYVWEERWIRDEGYAKLIPAAVRGALGAAHVGIEQIHTLVLASPLKDVGRAVAKQLGFTGTVADTLDAQCGYTATAHPLLMLAAALESATPGQKLLLVGFGQGAEAAVLETTGALAKRTVRRGVAGSLAAGISTSDYLRYASFYGEVEPEWGMRGEKTGKVALSNQYRETEQLAAFVAGKCARCGTVQFPQLAYCVQPECAAPSSQFEDYPLSEEPAQVVTFTADWLSYYPAPPLYVGFAQFEVGARVMMEIVDVPKDSLEVGTRLEMVYRIKEPDKVRGFNRYFWKATPRPAAPAIRKETV